MKRVAILQSNYIPWKGYFDLISYVDEFIIYDDVQFTKNDWRNRNKIKTPTGLQWLTVPVGQDINRRICDVAIESPAWQSKHWKTLASNYGRSKFFEEISDWLMPLYMQEDYKNLSAMNITFMKQICHYLNIETKISSSREYELISGRTERLVSLCLQAGATHYISGPAGKGYIQEKLFSGSGVELGWFSYEGYPTYEQLWNGFEHGVSILDLLFNCGLMSAKKMKWVHV